MRWFSMKGNGKRENRKGFTLAEVLVVVGILAALTLVAVPSVLHYQRTLKYNELDDNARAIFVAAQNHLTALRSASAEALAVPAAGRPAEEVPDGAVDGLESGTKLWYVSTDVASADPDWLVLPGSIESDLAKGCYLVEFDPDSGAVYGVFFAERDGTHTLDEAAYQKISQYTDDGNSCRVKKGRQAFARASGGFPVGYYGADGALDLARPESETLPKPTVKLINAEELVLEIGTDAASWSSTVKQSNVYLSVTVSDGTTAKTLVSKGSIPSGSSATVVLDTLKTSGYNRNETQNAAGWTVGGSFAQWAEGTSLLPGTDITVTASTWYQPEAGEGVVALPQTTSVTTNSLFAARAGDTVEVAYGRHLQNLSSSLSHLDPSITAARQVREIDFTKTGDPTTHKDDVYYWIDAYPGKNLSAIQNTNLTSYDGNSLAIRNMNASGMPYGGLFGNFSKGRLANIVLVDATVSGPGYAGALAGVAGNGSAAPEVVVDNCQVYLTRYTDTPRITGANAGGLVGHAWHVTIENSFASTVVNGSATAGGLVGNNDVPLTITNSYAAGHLSGGTVGGLVGSQMAAQMTVQNSYAAGTVVRATAKAGGLVGAVTSGASVNISRSYAAVEYGPEVPAGNVCGIAPSPARASSTYYLVKSGVNESGVGTAVADPGQMRKSQGLALGSAFVEGGDPTVMARPYNLPNTAEDARDPKLYAPYPYPTLTVGEGRMSHYGDWLASGETAFLAYYERYADGTWGVAYPTPAEGGTETVASTLREGGDVLAVEDGYGVLSPGAMSALPVGTDSVALTETDCALTVDDKDYRLYALDGAWTLSHHGYCQTTVGGQSVWFDPDFAKTATLTETTSATRYLVRSVRQLDNIDDPLYTGSNVTFDQDLTIDGGAYEGAVYGKSAGDWKTFPVQYAETPFVGTLDGHRDKGFMIRNLSITGTTRAGFFGEIGAGAGGEAAVRNLALASVKVNATGWGDVYAGGLAGVISGGTVSNSGIFVVDAAGDTRNAPYEDYPVTGEIYANTSVGGLAGSVTGGKVSKCFAAVKVTGANAGGLIGRLTGGEVRDCYAAGHTVNGVFKAPTNEDKCANITGNNAAGGFVGDWTAGTIAGTCYTTLSVDGMWSNKWGAFAGSHPAGAKLTGSYAKSYVYQGGALKNPVDVDELGLDTSSVYTGDKGPANPYDSSLSAEYDFKPIPGLEHYGDWSLKKLRGLVAYYEQVDLSQGSGGGPNLKTEFFYYEREQSPSGGYVLTEKGTLDKSRTGPLYSDGYAFLSLNQLHQTGQENQPVTLKIDIGGSASLADMEEYPTTYLGGFNADLTPFVEKWDGSKPYYYAYGLPNAALDVAANADEYFLQLKVAGLDSEAEQSSLWLNPHFGRTAYNGYGETNPKDGNPRVKIPDGTEGTMIPIRSVRQFNNMRKYPSDIDCWVQELEMDGAQYKGHVDVDSEGYLTVGGLRVATQSDGTWSPVKAPSATPTTADLPTSYRLEIEPITMHSKKADQASFGGAYDGGGYSIRNLNVRTITIDSNQYAALFYRLSGSATLKNVELADSAILGVSASGSNYTGGLTGYTEGTILNCTVRNCTVTQKDGNNKSYVGGLVGYARGGEIGVDKAGTAGPCAAINCAVDGGASDSVGGFVGYVRGATLQNCGVRVEAATVGGAKKTAADLYDTQLVQGNNQVGGFVGGVKEGKVQYCYAAVKVSGGHAGGFGGLFSGGTIANCYAAGHTRNGVYVANDPNVAGSQEAGGFLGAWSGGTLSGLCYTTCSAATVNGTVDVFVPVDGKTAPAGCYAGGDVMKSGVAQDVSKYNVTKVAVRPLAERPAAEQGAAVPYDKTLPQKYSHQAITLPNGSAMPHYGDWYHKKTTANREWVQQLPDSNSRTFDNLEVAADWQGDTLHVNFDVFHNWESGQNLANAGVYTNGVYAITTDLGYRLIFRVVPNGTGGYDIKGLDGFVWNSERVAMDGTDYDAKPEGEQDGNYHDTLDFTIPLEMIPPHVRYIYIGFLEDDYLAVIEHDHSGTLDPRDQAVKHLPLDATVTVDGDFTDWLGYEHKIMEFLPGAEGTPLYGHTTGSFLGYENKVYLHVINEDKDDIFPSSNLNIPIFNFNLVAKGENIQVSTAEWGWKLTQQPYPTVPGTQEYVVRQEKWDEKLGANKQYDIFHFILSVTEDRQEYEMEIDLDALAQFAGYESGDVFTDVTANFPTPWGSLEVIRDPKS